MSLPLLHYKSYGQGESSLIILHGLFGTLDNWHNVARVLAENRQVISVDLRNHGKSFHHPEMNLELMSDDVKRLTDYLGIETFDLMGHSMGGKVSMQFALDHPGTVNHLIVADISPKLYPAGHNEIFEAMFNLPLEQIHSRSQAENLLAVKIKEEGTRLFLLKNIGRKDKEGFEWKINLSAIHENYPHILKEIEADWPYGEPVLFLKGEKSNYITEEDEGRIIELFPEAIFETIPNAGHWLHADNPVEYIKAVERFLETS
jgi:pimeloyl-ACP methyl ester carboxylesterase